MIASDTMRERAHQLAARIAMDCERHSDDQLYGLAIAAMAHAIIAARTLGQADALKHLKETARDYERALIIERS